MKTALLTPFTPGLAKRNDLIGATARTRVGATLLEQTFVILILLAIIIGALSLAYTTMRQNTVTQEVQTLTNLAGAVFKTKSSDGFIGNEIGPNLGNMGMIPTNVTNTGTAQAPALKNTWGGNITFDDDDAGGAFTITYTNIPKEDCVQMVTAVKQSILNSVGSGTSATHNIGANGDAAQLTPAIAAATICPANAGNTVTWSSMIK